MSTHEQIKKTIEHHDVVLFMKGTRDFPQCGFSGRVVEILDDCNTEFMDVNVLEDPGLRDAIKEYSNWPTLPQLYIRGQFIGGCDIVTELYNKGDLQKLLAGT